MQAIEWHDRKALKNQINTFSKIFDEQKDSI